MRTYDEVSADARDEPAFSNGTESMSWTANWCERCIHDGDHIETPFCPLFGVAFCEGKTPVEWMDQDGFRLGDQYHCIEFRDEKDGPGPEPQPIPDPPGQELLLPREPFEGTRMFTQPRSVEVSP